ncbi:unnamed protein product [Ectocarpus sp. CCAP 1310/34]|nr:unnamed protein product [Ectocarpus sp. CCAP 1310/34]
MGGVGVSFDDPDTVEHQLRYESRPYSSESPAHSGSGGGGSSGGGGGDGREDTTASPPVPCGDVGGRAEAGAAVPHSPGRDMSDTGSSGGSGGGGGGGCGGGGDGHLGPATAGGGRGLDHECRAAHANGHVDADNGGGGGGGGCLASSWRQHSGGDRGGGGGGGEGGDREMETSKPISASGATVPRAQTIEGTLESIASGKNTGAALVAMGKWAAHRRLLRRPPGVGAAEPLSPLFDSAALPAVFEKLLLLASATTKKTSAGGGSDGDVGSGQQQQQRQGNEEGLLGEARAGLDNLLRWAMPNLDGGTPDGDNPGAQAVVWHCWELVTSVRRLCSHGDGVPLTPDAARLLSQKLVDELRAHRKEALRVEQRAAAAAGMSAMAAAASAKCNGIGGGGGVSGKRGLPMEELFRQRELRLEAASALGQVCIITSSMAPPPSSSRPHPPPAADNNDNNGNSSSMSHRQRQQPPPSEDPDFSRALLRAAHPFSLALVAADEGGEGEEEEDCGGGGGGGGDGDCSAVESKPSSERVSDGADADDGDVGAGDVGAGDVGIDVRGGGGAAGEGLVLQLSRGKDEVNACRARLRSLEEDAERELGPLDAAVAESGARLDVLAEQRRKIQEQLRMAEETIEAEQQVRGRALAEAGATRAKFEERRGVEAERLRKWEDAVSYARECQNIPSVYSNLRRYLDSQLASALNGVFPGGGGEAKSASALGAYTDSLQAYFETEAECVRRLRERARADEAEVAAVEKELVEYEGLDMPTLTTGLRARMQQLRNEVAEDREAEHAIMSQARHQFTVLESTLSAYDSTRTTGCLVSAAEGCGGGGDGGVGGVAAGIGSGTAGLDYPRPPDVSAATVKKIPGTSAAASAAGGVSGANGRVGAGSLEGSAAAAGLARVRELFALLEVVGSGEEEPLAVGGGGQSGGDETKTAAEALAGADGNNNNNNNNNNNSRTFGEAAGGAALPPAGTRDSRAQSSGVAATPFGQAGELEDHQGPNRRQGNSHGNGGRPRNPAPSRIRGGVRLPSPSRGGGNSLQGRLNWLDNGGPSASGTDRSSTARAPEGAANNNNNNNDAGSKTKAVSVSAAASRGGGRGGNRSSASGGRGRRGEQASSSSNQRVGSPADMQDRGKRNQAAARVRNAAGGGDRSRSSSGSGGAAKAPPPRSGSGGSRNSTPPPPKLGRGGGGGGGGGGAGGAGGGAAPPPFSTAASVAAVVASKGIAGGSRASRQKASSPAVQAQGGAKRPGRGDGDGGSSAPAEKRSGAPPGSGGDRSVAPAGEGGGGRGGSGGQGGEDAADRARKENGGGGSKGDGRGNHKKGRASARGSKGGNAGKPSKPPEETTSPDAASH